MGQEYVEIKIKRVDTSFLARFLGGGSRGERDAGSGLSFGADFTILNPSGATQFTFRLDRVNDDVIEVVRQMKHLNAKGQTSYEVRDIVAYLEDSGVKLIFDKVEHCLLYTSPSPRD